MKSMAMQCESKIFCVGFGKTGTTSLEAFFSSLGFQTGDQAGGELLLQEWAVRNFTPIISLARSAQFFQDAPFNYPFTFQAMDMTFPNSKFILSVRDNSEQWYRSLTRFHTKIIGKGTLPTVDDLGECLYRYKGWMLEAFRLAYDVSDEEPYAKEKVIRAYERHNDEVKRYFRYRKESLLVVKVSDESAARQIMEFVGLQYRGEQMPHLNRSDEAA
jgi:hypothetical protein